MPIMKGSCTSKRTRGMVKTSHGRVKGTPLDCKRTLPPAHSCGGSARPPPPRRAPAGPTSPPLRDVPASGETWRRVGTSESTVRAGHARPLLQKRCVTLASSSISCPGAHRAPALLPFFFPRATHAIPCPTAATAAPNDPDSVPQRQQQPRPAKNHEQVRRPGPGPLVPELAVCGRRPAPRPRDDY